MYELKYGRLLTEGESFMGDKVCLEAVRFFFFQLPRGDSRRSPFDIRVPQPDYTPERV